MVTLAAAFHSVRRALDQAGVTYAIGVSSLEPGFYFDTDAALAALAHGRPFNVIHQKLGYKFDFFPVVDDHGEAELAAGKPSPCRP